MKLFRILAPVVFLTIMNVAQAQTSAPAFTDEDLKKYAITMDSVKGMQTTLQAIISEMVQKNTVMSVARYNELFKIAADQTKLAEAKATPEEIKFVNDVAEKRKEESARINATYQGLAKDYVGVTKFNAIKKSLASDEAVKAKYEGISKEIGSKGGE
jgi:Skp family chaperone for outer membrane proteins